MATPTFKQLHSKDNFFVLGNCWDIVSAKIYENMGYKAIGTSSFAMSFINGVKDGENLSFEQVFSSVKMIVKNIFIPLSVDIEKGYGADTKTICENVLKLADIGCLGINIEDSNKDGNLVSSSDFSSVIEHIKSALQKHKYDDFVINARTDTYLCNVKEKIEETILRAKDYKEAGADCLFVPGLFTIDEINKISKSIQLPLNILNLPNISDANKLKLAGVTRLSLGNCVFDEMISYLEKRVSQTAKTSDYAKHYDHEALKVNF